MKRSLLTVLFFVIPMAVWAVTPPPVQPFEAREWPASLSKQPSIGIQLGILLVLFEKTTLDQVRSAAHLGEVEQQGETGEHIRWLCYTLLSQGNTDRIWIISHGEMGGPQHEVTSVAAQRLKDAKATPDCPSLPSSLQPVSLDTNIWLGTTNNDLDKLLGQASHQTENWRSYDFETKVPGNCDGGYDLTSWLTTNSERGSVTSIFVGQVTSC